MRKRGQRADSVESDGKAGRAAQKQLAPGRAMERPFDSIACVTSKTSTVARVPAPIHGFESPINAIVLQPYTWLGFPQTHHLVLSSPFRPASVPHSRVPFQHHDLQDGSSKVRP